MRIAIACSKSWFLDFQNKNLKKFILIKTKKELNYKFLKKNKIKYIFFPHWSYKIPKIIYKNFECIIFHTGNLPNHRGGSPIQNLIIRGFKHSYLNALKAESKLDAGPIYIKKKISLAGSVDEIFLRISKKILIIIKYIIQNKPKPKKQKGKATYFKRLDRNSSMIDTKISSIEKLYDKIRMLDGKNYTNANLNINNFNLSFKKATKHTNKIYVSCVIKKITK